MNKKHLATSSLLAGTLFLSAYTSAMGFGAELINGSDSILLNNKNNESMRWSGIGEIFWGDDSICTASLLDTRDKANNAVGPAYLLTAADCVVGVRAVPHLLQPQPVPITVKFNYFNDTPGDYKTYTIRTATWNNSEHTNLAIMELESPLATLLEDGITPLKIAPKTPDLSNDVLISSTGTKQQETGLRVKACSQEPTGGAVISGESRMYLNTLKIRCGAEDYYSKGAPVLERNSGNILSVLSIGTYKSTIERQCFDYAPCEVKNGQPQWSAETQYGHAVDFLSSCFNEGVFTNTAKACTFERTFEVTDLDNYSRYTAMPLNDAQPNARATFSLSTPYYRFKTARDVKHCSQSDGYSDISSATDAAIKSPIPREPGIYFLCVIGVESAEQSLSAELMKNTLILPTQLVERTPVELPLNPNYGIYNDGSLGLRFSQRLPSNLAIRYYKGPFKDTDCSNVDRKDYVHASHEAPIKAEEFPFTLCIKNVDLSYRVSKEALIFHFDEEGRMSR
ncbi:trypsin-like serine peptidase [Pseudomonas sp. LB3P81]